MHTRTALLPTVALVAAAAGCSGSLPTPPSCNVAAQTGCGDGLVCEAVDAGGSICAVPIEVRGRVFSLADGAAVAGARVAAQDPNRSPISTVAVTGPDGSFSTRISAVRSSNASPIASEVLLRADARGYRTFPSGIRQAFPVSTSSGTSVNGVIVVSGEQTEIGLEPFVGAGAASIHGRAAVPADSPGVLVVAEEVDPDTATTVVGSALADRDGDYAIYNLPAGTYTVRAYARGAVHASPSETLEATEDALVNIPITGPATSTVSGNVQIVNPGSGTGTSVILVVESTFDGQLVRGESPPGLRAPGGLVPDLKGEYSIPGVPPGRYVALAAYENDFLVRDPDLCIGGTQIVRFGVPETLTLPGFKITGSLDVISPGGSGPEVVSARPTFTWKDDSSEDSYEVTVIDSGGNEVWSTQIPGVSGGNPSVTYPDLEPPLEPGYYQFKVRSVANKTCDQGGEPIASYRSQTEDLKGVFIVP